MTLIGLQPNVIYKCSSHGWHKHIDILQNCTLRIKTLFEECYDLFSRDIFWEIQGPAWFKQEFEHLRHLHQVLVDTAMAICHGFFHQWKNTLTRDSRPLNGKIVQGCQEKGGITKLILLLNIVRTPISHETRKAFTCQYIRLVVPVALSSSYCLISASREPSGGGIKGAKPNISSAVWCGCGLHKARPRTVRDLRGV